MPPSRGRHQLTALSPCCGILVQVRDREHKDVRPIDAVEDPVRKFSGDGAADVAVKDLILLGVARHAFESGLDFCGEALAKAGVLQLIPARGMPQVGFRLAAKE